MRTIEVQLPTLHEDQVKVYLQQKDLRGGEWAKNTARFKAVRCGRRWGKTDLCKTIACDGAVKQQYIGWFAPDYKTISEAYEEIVDILEPVKKASSKQHGVFRAITGGRIDFWTLENERAGRSRKYHKVIVDEAAFTKSGVMMKVWDQSIFPTLYDYGGSALVVSNTNGVDSENFFWQICNQPEHGFIEYHAPTINNPLIPARKRGESVEDFAERRLATFNKIKSETHPLVFAQEYLADFVDWSGVAFFALDKMLVDGAPIDLPHRCDAVFAVIDSATKTGKENDATAVVYFARSTHVGHPLIVLDWDVVQIEGSLLETWLPTVLQNLNYYTTVMRVRNGSLGAWIEDKASGEILLQQATRRGFLATAIESRLTAMGKDERAISVSGYHYRGEIKITREAYDKVSTFKGTTRNHFISQVTGFRIGDKEAAHRADDALDCYCYGIAIALGDSGGF